MADQVDFYILPEHNQHSIYRLACRLCEKAYQQDHRVYIHTEDVKEMHLFDDLLWTYTDISFLPHECVGNQYAKWASILIGCGEAPKDEKDVLILLTQMIPAFYCQFGRILEISDQAPHNLQKLRAHYRYYQHNPITLNHHFL